MLGAWTMLRACRDSRAERTALVMNHAGTAKASACIGIHSEGQPHVAVKLDPCMKSQKTLDRKAQTWSTTSTRNATSTLAASAESATHPRTREKPKISASETANIFVPGSKRNRRSFIEGTKTSAMMPTSKPMHAAPSTMYIAL